MNNINWKDPGAAGLVIGNSTISCDVASDGRMYRRIQYNPPSFDPCSNSLRYAGNGTFVFSVDGKEVQDSTLEWNVIEKTYPRYQASSVIDDVDVGVCAFAPLEPYNNESLFLPFAVTEFIFTNNSATDKTLSGAFLWRFDPQVLLRTVSAETEVRPISDGHYLAQRDDLFISAFGCDSAECADAEGDILSLNASFSVHAGESRRVVFQNGIFEENHYLRTKYYSATAVALHGEKYFESLKRGVDEFIALVPHTGDDKIYLYTRWYMQAAVLLTKGVKSGEIMTMGYTELNQRDSFWTSFIHLVLWPEIEKSIMRLSARWMRDDGKIPTTLLPLIEREYDIDINQYFCLRVARYYNYHRDVQFLEEMYEPYCRSIDFLMTLDCDGDGIPEQQPPENPECFWGDWKDVMGVCGRRLAPHFCLLWLAVLKEGIRFAELMGDSERAERFFEMYNDSYEKINRGVEDGGLWLDDHYAEVWYDGRRMTEVLQDQTVGMVFGVVTSERAGDVYSALQRNENDFGIMETYPYRDNFYYEGGDYHNGGVWPYLMFCDIMGRYLYGYADDAERLIKKTGYYDLEVPGDFAPNEYMNSVTGQNCGKEIQGWSSALYGAITQGAFRINHTGERSLEIKVNFKDRDFKTELLLPRGYGRVTLARVNGELTCSAPKCEGYSITLVQ